MEDKVILVDINDNVMGEETKTEAHRKGLLHRAVSVFIFNKEKKMLLQRRAAEKYHSPGLWTNAACTHPYMDEDVSVAAMRRLKEEMNLTVHKVHPLFQFVYKEELDRGMWEHEYDHVFFAITDEVPEPNADEVQSYLYVNQEDLLIWIESRPSDFTVWFKKIVHRVVDEMKKH